MFGGRKQLGYFGYILNGKHLQTQCFQEFLLALYTADIPQLVRTEAHILTALFPVQVLVAVFDINFQLCIRVFIPHVLVNVQVHAADQVDDFNEALPVGQRIIMNRDAQQIGDGLLGHGHSAIRIG